MKLFDEEKQKQFAENISIEVSKFFKLSFICELGRNPKCFST